MCIYASELHCLSRVDSCASISWKLLNTFTLLTLVCTTALLVVALLGYQSKWYCIPLRNVVPFENAQLAPKPASTHNKLTLVTAHLRLKNACIERSLNRNF